MDTRRTQWGDTTIGEAPQPLSTPPLPTMDGGAPPPPPGDPPVSPHRVPRPPPDGSFLAIGSHDNFIYIYSVAEAGHKYSRFGRCAVGEGLGGAGGDHPDPPCDPGPLLCLCPPHPQGHSSFITHLDWSKDGRFIMSNSGDYEILYCEGGDTGTPPGRRRGKHPRAWGSRPPWDGVTTGTEGTPMGHPWVGGNSLEWRNPLGRGDPLELAGIPPGVGKPPDPDGNPREGGIPWGGGTTRP